MTVLLSWSYFSRLWCLFEWTMFVALHDVHQLSVRFVPFPSQENMLLFVESIAHISVDRALCSQQVDKDVLLAKIGLYFRGRSPGDSCDTFERFAKLSAIAVLAMHLTEYITADA